MPRRAAFAVKRSLSELAHTIATLGQRRPTIELQAEAGDCGYVCISALMSLLGQPTLVHEIKELAGTTARGLTLRQVREGLRSCGASADVVFFDRNRSDSYPCKGILLLTSGHYVVISRRKGDRLEVFDPQLGWSWTSCRKLARRCGGLGVQVGDLVAPAETKSRRTLSGLIGHPLKLILNNRSGRYALAIFAIAQLVTLVLPLLSMWSVDRSVGGVSAGIIGAIAIGFVALSITNVVISLIGELIQNKTKRLAAVSLSKVVFDSLAQKPAYWFETNTAASLQNRVGSLDTLLDFYVDVVRTIGSITMTFTIGILALLFISPLLIIPSLCALTISIILDLLFERSQRNQFVSAIETVQRRQAFVLDTLSQLPLIARFGALPSAKNRYASMVRTSAIVEARLQSLRGWRGAIGSLTKSGETLFFVTIAAAFMGAGNFTIGGFVALGAYKELLANAIGSIFQLVLQRRTLEVHKLQASTLLTSDRHVRASRQVEGGTVAFNRVSFAYGSLDRPVLDDVQFSAQPGECIVIRGPSGAGKSTIAKLLVGQLIPTAGEITIQGLPLADTMLGMAAVLQSDRLIGGTIRENIALFRRNVCDAKIFEALETASLDNFVRGLPMGLTTQVSEGFGGLSGGQRQRLLIARAVLSDPKIIILDEATSSLEVEVEAKILRNLRASGATTILIAHRPEVWALADRVYSLDEQGRLSGDPPAKPEVTTLYDSGNFHPSELRDVG